MITAADAGEGIAGIILTRCISRKDEWAGNGAAVSIAARHLDLKMYSFDSSSNAAIYLIGSRANVDLKGGDIDILVTGEQKLSGQQKRNIRLAFYKEAGEQKLDLVSLKHSDPSAFKEFALIDSVKL